MDELEQALAGLSGIDGEDITEFVPSAKTMLAEHVHTRLRASREAYELQFLQIFNCLRIMRGIVLSGWEGEGGPEVEGDQIKNLNWPVAAAIATNILAVLQDVFGTAIDAPFTCAATTDVELPADVRKWLKDRLSENMDALIKVSGTDPAAQKQAIDGMFAVAKEQMQQRANDAAAQLDSLAKAHVREGGWEKEFEEFLYNYIVFPVAIMKGPFKARRPIREWNELLGFAEVVDKDVWCVENVSPFQFYPAPNAKDCQSAEYIIHIQRMSGVAFAQLMELEDFDTDAIDACMQESPEGHIEPYCNGTDVDPTLNPHEWTLGSTAAARGFYDVVQFYGRVRGGLLKDVGVHGVEDEQWYEAEVEVCGDHVIRAKVKRDGIVSRPFYAVSYQPVSGSIFGESVCSKLFNVQRVAEATIRELMENMSLASRPFVEINADRIPPDQVRTAPKLSPGDIKITTNGMSGDNRPAYTFTSVPSNLEQMREFMDYAITQAYEIIGFSKAALGGAPGTVGRTSSGMSIALNQAAKPIKLKIASLGRNIIKPIITRYIDIILENNPDPTVRGDIHVYPKGVDGLVDNEQQSQNIQMAMQNLPGIAQLMAQGGAAAKMALALFQQWCKLNNVPVEGLGNMELEEAAAQSTGAAYEAQPQGQLAPPAPPTPPMDGRAAFAAQSVQAANNLPETTAR